MLWDLLLQATTFTGQLLWLGGMHAIHYTSTTGVTQIRDWLTSLQSGSLDQTCRQDGSGWQED